MNVAFTRAKTKLIVIGSANTLSCDAVFQKFLSIVRERNWILCLGPNAHMDYAQASSSWCHDDDDNDGVDRNVVKRSSIDPRKLCKKGGILAEVLMDTTN